MSRLWRGAAKAGLAATAVGLAVSVLSAQAAFALGTLGTATPVNPNTLAPLAGTQASTQQFGEQLSPTSGLAVAYCSGSTSGNSTEEDSYLVPSTTDPSTLTFATTGVTGAGNFSLYEVAKTKVININTAAPNASGQGQVLAIPTDIVFGGVLPASVVLPGGVASASWNAGIACVVPPAAGGNSTVSDYWNCVVTFTAVGAAVDPNLYQWSANCGGNANVPESPLAIGMPIGGAVVLGGGGYFFLRRRRRAVVPGAPAAA
jgi:hypothetical protein